MLRNLLSISFSKIKNKSESKQILMCQQSIWGHETRKNTDKRILSYDAGDFILIIDIYYQQQSMIYFQNQIS